MLSNISYKHKNVLLLSVTAVFLIVAYFLAFRKTIDAISLNNQLKSKSKTTNNLAYSPLYLKRKNEVLERLLDIYRVDKSQWKDHFWTTVSNLAYEKDINIIYSPDKEQTSSSMDSSLAIIRQNIQFSGSYQGLVKLTSSLENKEQNGQITALKMKDYGKEQKKILLDISFAALEK